jgi:hypothetical protein
VSDKPARFLYDQGFMAALMNIDSSYAECVRDGRLAIYIDYRRGVPQSIQLIRMPAPVSFKIHLSVEDSA